MDKSLSNPKHPYCHFSTGNLEVLKIQPESRGINVREKFMEFHEKHYSANRMKLVILGREPLDKLESWAADLFAGVRNKDLPQNRWEDEQPYGPDQLSTQYFAKPVMDSRTLDISIPFIDEELLFESQPSRYLTHLIGHEGPGSIMAYIKSKGWANALSAGKFHFFRFNPAHFSKSLLQDFQFILILPRCLSNMSWNSWFVQLSNTSDRRRSQELQGSCQGFLSVYRITQRFPATRMDF